MCRSRFFLSNYTTKTADYNWFCDVKRGPADIASAGPLQYLVLSPGEKDVVLPVPPVDGLHIPVHGFQAGVLPLVEHAGAAGGAEPPGHRGQLGLQAVLLQGGAGPHGRQVGVEGGDVPLHYLVSVSLVWSPLSSTATLYPAFLP